MTALTHLRDFSSAEYYIIGFFIIVLLLCNFFAAYLLFKKLIYVWFYTPKKSKLWNEEKKE